jgi:hypothetical protein
MRRAVRALAFAVGGFVVLALGVEVVLGVFQPAFESGEEGVLRTFDEDGNSYETRLVLIDDDGTLWIQSAHHFRAWYDRVLRVPEVELVRGNQVRAYHAVPLDTPETEARIEALLGQRVGPWLHFIRALQLGADVKPVRLDPVTQ